MSVKHYIKIIIVGAAALSLIAGCGDLSVRSADGVGNDTEISENGADMVSDVTEVNENFYTADTPISEVINDPAFGDYGRLIFPTDSGYYSGNTLGELRLTWYSNIQPEMTVEIANYMRSRAAAGEAIFYDIYTDEEKAADPDKADTGLFFFRGKEGAPFAICNAGGGFAYVGAMHDSFPHALYLSEQGYNAFALIYRPGAQTACEDLARAIAFIFENADELGVSTDGYSLWGGSAGARIAAWLGSYGTESFGEAAYPRPAAVIMQYTGLSEVTGDEPPTYACVGTNDGIASYRTMQSRIDAIRANGTDAEIEIFEGLSHGFGLGTDTVAEGWIDNAIEFWERNRSGGEATINIPQTGYTGAVPDSYFLPAERQGTVVEITYSSKDYAGDGADITKPAFVYLPYGYDENDEDTRYDIFYMMHGWTGTADEMFSIGGGIGQNLVDNMIANGDIPPIIVVAATFDAENAPQDFTRSVAELRQFYQDFANDLMPAVEWEFHTYAASASDEDLKDSRDHRAFGGFSLGSVTTWLQFCYNYDYIRYFLPMSGSCWYYGTYGDFQTSKNVDFIEQLVEENDLDDRGYFIYFTTGTEDTVKSQSIAQAEEMLARPKVFTPEHFVFYQKDGGYHDYNAAIEYIYNALPLFFGGE